LLHLTFVEDRRHRKVRDKKNRKRRRALRGFRSLLSKKGWVSLPAMSGSERLQAKEEWDWNRYSHQLVETQIFK
jgi:hypothetical protein